MNRGSILRFTTLAFVALGAACTLSDAKAPPLSGPSELGLSFAIFANPDVLSQDGASQALVVVNAYDANGQPARNVPIRAEIVVNGIVTDFGSISTRNIVTDNNGRATVTYTAPAAPLVSIDSGTRISILMTPVNGNAADAVARGVDIRLVPPGVIIGGSGPTAFFTVSPASPAAFTPATFDASSSAPGAAVIVAYSWSFGDGTIASGTQVFHQFPSGTYTVTLTVLDNAGLTHSSSQLLTVGVGNLPTAAFVISPSTGNVTNQTIFFNASSSTPGAGRRLVRHDWDFGTGATASGVIVSKSFDTVGSFNVTLTVTDDVGQFDTQTTAVSIAANATSAPTARFTFTPSPGRVGQPVSFDGTPSSTSGGAIVRYEWTFGDGAIETTYAPIATTQHTYTTSGNKTASLIVYDSNGVASASTPHTINVLP